MSIIFTGKGELAGGAVGHGGLTKRFDDVDLKGAGRTSRGVSSSARRAEALEA